MFKFIFGTALGIAIAPVARPYIIKKLDEFTTKLEGRVTDVQVRREQDA